MRKTLIPAEKIENKIFLIRGEKVILDKDLAKLYEVETRTLIQAVKRNIERFPQDFMFQLTKKEFDSLMSQFVISSWGGTRKLPHAFTEHGVAMLSSVLKSKRAILVNIQIMRTFTKLRKMLLAHEDLKRKVEAIEKKYDRQFKVVFDAIRKLLAPLEKPKRRIGFHLHDD
jgi:hypothetical protein